MFNMLVLALFDGTVYMACKVLGFLASKFSMVLVSLISTMVPPCAWMNDDVSVDIVIVC
jgi:hypothetical protein